MNGLEPLVQRDVAVLKNRTNLDGKLLAASGAFFEADPSRVAFEEVRTTDHATVRAHRTTRPEQRLDMLVSGLLALEMDYIEKGRGHGASLPKAG
jgi:hypothetical protein